MYMFLFFLIIFLLILIKFFIINGKKCKFSPNLEGKICVITGANTGIGFYTAKRITELDATVIFACRNQ